MTSRLTGVSGVPQVRLLWGLRLGGPEPPLLQVVQPGGPSAWRAGLVAGLRVGQAYGVFHRPGFGLLGSVPRSLSTQPPFATQALIQFCKVETNSQFSILLYLSFFII